ncbi:MAG: DNA mismatch repair endonuclease MutL [Bacteroidales bacterium]|jgi:DNA mismatch repair protein MutL|nr:DNA mismatch repair endonuclease MutL [Bacteroidales bacterium]
MPDIIQLLPDSVANQIAAGEVIQRPASVVKELVENSVDAQAESITINIKDAGKTLIQIIDNGCGMSETDARLAFERHSTSKIRKANDLFAIKTMGFRGEALASIAAIANVELKTKTGDKDIGTCINVEGSEMKNQTPVSCLSGTSFSIKNLFFNVPARRKFLKKNVTEFNHIINEFQRIVLTHPNIEFKLFHNNSEIYHLPKSNKRQRIIGIFGKKTNLNLISLKSETSIINIDGFIGKPENAKKRFGEQFFFINNRFMRNPYLHKAIMNAYQGILPHDTIPSYFINLEASPDTIDINIHPTKTEIKFENQQAVWQILHAAIKQTLGKNNIVPSIDFDQDKDFSISSLTKNTVIRQPSIEINPRYNPFDAEKKSFNTNRDNTNNWQKLYEGFENESPEKEDKQLSTLLSTNINNDSKIQKGNTISDNFFQFKNKYILTPVKSGLMLINQKRAHERILFEKYLYSLKNETAITQKNLFPNTIELTSIEYSIIINILNEINSLGFDIKDIGNNSIIVNGMPADTNNKEPKEIIDQLLFEYQNSEIDISEKGKEKVAQSLAKAAAIGYNQTLCNKEMQEITDLLFACSAPNYSPSGKKIISIINTEELEKDFI